jgi:hypothetical protein
MLFFLTFYPEAGCEPLNRVLHALCRSIAKILSPEFNTCYPVNLWSSCMRRGLQTKEDIHNANFQLDSLR